MFSSMNCYRKYNRMELLINGQIIEIPLHRTSDMLYFVTVFDIWWERLLYQRCCDTNWKTEEDVAKRGWQSAGMVNLISISKGFVGLILSR